MPQFLQFTLYLTCQIFSSTPYDRPVFFSFIFSFVFVYRKIFEVEAKKKMDAGQCESSFENTTWKKKMTEAFHISRKRNIDYLSLVTLVNTFK